MLIQRQQVERIPGMVFYQRVLKDYVTILKQTQKL
jgi:hypothetical protein